MILLNVAFGILPNICQFVLCLCVLCRFEHMRMNKNCVNVCVHDDEHQTILSLHIYFFSFSFVWNEWFVHRTCMPFGFRQKGLLFVVVGAAAAAVIFILVYLFVSLMLDCTVFISILIKRYDSTLDKISFSLFVSLSVSFSHPICVYRTYAAFKASFFCSVLLLCSCVPCH